LDLARFGSATGGSADCSSSSSGRGSKSFLKKPV
jgi:hypothetical protein